jgi:hypothetical protein
MKLSNLLMIALLAGTLGVFGCNDDPTGTAGTGGSGTAGTGGSGTAGTGGTPAGNCDYGDCVDGSTQQQACEAGVTACMISPIGQEACIELANTDFCGPR